MPEHCNLVFVSIIGEVLKFPEKITIAWTGCQSIVVVTCGNVFRKEDLIVGAPFYSEAGHGGAIYIYMNSDEVRKLLMSTLKVLNF